MRKSLIKKAGVLLCCSAFAFSLIGCGSSSSSSTTATTTASEADTSGNDYDITTILSERDLVQTADLTEAKTITLTSGEDATITEEGVYVVSGDVTDVTIIVEAPDDAKVQIVLDGVTISNEDAPAIYVKTADKVFVTTTDSENSLEVTGTFVADGDTNLDAVIFSKSDLVLNGVGALDITSANGNGITSKDDLKVTGGTYTISSAEDGLEANDCIVIYDGTLNIDADADALHSENDEDDTLGIIYVIGGTMNITAGDDGIRGTSLIQIEGGTINIEDSNECIEATYILINGGTLTLYGRNDGINATAKSSAYDVAIEVNDGNITVEVGSGDTDGFDSNGSIYINGGTIDVTAEMSSFDWDVTGELNGGTVTVNGEVVTELPESMMGGGGGQMGGGGPGGMMR